VEPIIAHALPERRIPQHRDLGLRVNLPATSERLLRACSSSPPAPPTNNPKLSATRRQAQHATLFILLCSTQITRALVSHQGHILRSTIYRSKSTTDKYNLNTPITIESPAQQNRSPLFPQNMRTETSRSNSWLPLQTFHQLHLATCCSSDPFITKVAIDVHWKFNIIRITGKLTSFLNFLWIM
jgi:hypothetical protein